MKKKKKKTTKKRIDKCVKVFSVKIDKDMFDSIDVLFQKYGNCKNEFYQQFSGIKSMLKIQNAKSLRTEINRNTEGKLKEKYNFLSRHWVMALFDVCANIKSAWGNLANEVKEKIKENDNISDNEKSYLYYIVSVNELWYQVLNEKPLNISNMDTLNKLKEKILNDRFHYLHHYLSRTTRNCKSKIPHSEITNCISLDENMYKIIEEADGTYIHISSDVPNKPFIIKLRSKYCYDKKGNVQLILNRDKRCVEIHKLIESKTKMHSGHATIGIDKGYTTLLSCSDDKEYGINIGSLFTKASDSVNKRNTNRNHFIQLHQKLKNELEEIEQQLDVETDTLKTCNLLILKTRLYKKIVHIEEHHLGHKLYAKRHQRDIATLERETNYNIKKMFRESHVHFFSKEDLSFTSSKNKGKKCNRILNNWLKGTLNKRMEWLASYYNISFVDVNPAYTSKYCNDCGAKLLPRTGQHNEIANCPNCGKLNANTNAAKNIFDRIYDKEITLMTPYKKVGQILDKRYEQKNKAK